MEDVASSAPARARSASPDTSLLHWFRTDPAITRLGHAARESLQPAVLALGAALHVQDLAHALCLYRYVRLQRALVAALGCIRKVAAKRLNQWLDAMARRPPEDAAVADTDADADADDSRSASDAIVRLKHDAHRVYDVFGEPSDDAEWWPTLLKRIAGKRSLHPSRPNSVVRVLYLLNQHHDAISSSYGTSVPHFCTCTSLRLYASSACASLSPLAVIQHTWTATSTTPGSRVELAAPAPSSSAHHSTQS
jgi:hypothetical protein